MTTDDGRWGDDWALREASCCFTGHRLLRSAERQLITRELDRLLPLLCDEGIVRYFCGAARGFDLLCADRVAAARQRGIPVQLIMAVPCADQTAKWRPFEREEHDRLCARADQVRVLSPAYHEGCMQARNEYMVDRSALCLCYLTRMRGGTLSTVVYAGAVHVPVLNLAIAQDAEACADRLLQKHVDELPF